MCSVKASRSVNDFSLKLFSELCANGRLEENLFYSPTSICIALAMAYAGCRGETAKEIEKCINWHNPNETHETMATLQQSLCGHAGVELDLANRLWVQGDIAILEEFNQVLQNKYQADMGVVDFARQTERARITINKWIAEKTKNKIIDLLGQGSVTFDTKVVLTNAVYFKGYWSHQFDKHRTQDWNFKTAQNKLTKIRLMNRTDKFLYAQNSQLRCQVIELPYKENKVSMTILLPNANSDLTQLLNMITMDHLEACSRMMSLQEVAVGMPKFKVDCQLKLKQTLRQLGITDLFTSTADLSGITGSRELFVSDVIHQAFVDVTEEGTEAAAATAIILCPTGMVPTKQPPQFLADHPFMFIIKHRETNTILFIGQIVNPSSEHEI